MLYNFRIRQENCKTRIDNPQYAVGFVVKEGFL